MDKKIDTKELETERDSKLPYEPPGIDEEEVFDNFVLGCALTTERTCGTGGALNS